MSTLSSIQVKSFLVGFGVSLSLTILYHRFSTRFRLGRKEAADYADAETPTDRLCDQKGSSKIRIVDSPDLDLRLIRKAEAIIRLRTSAIILVVERCTNDHNYSAILRTAEALGIQHVWIIDPPAVTDGAGNVENDEIEKSNNRQRTLPSARLTAEEIEQRKLHRLFAQNATDWLTIQDFRTTRECIDACKESGYKIWVTDLSQMAVPLVPEILSESGHWPLPPKIAVVMGTEAVGVSQEMLDSADLRIYLPLRGFADSLNLSVATALVIHQIFMIEPSFVGKMSEKERFELRKAWFPKLARQRLLSNSDKKKRRKILTALERCDELQLLEQAGSHLSREQKEKLTKRMDYLDELKKIEEGSNYTSTAVDKAVADFICSPPAPLDDLRRADGHRVTFVGKNIKKHHKQHWKDLAAVSKTVSPIMATASFFRERVAAVARETKK